MAQRQGTQSKRAHFKAHLMHKYNNTFSHWVRVMFLIVHSLPEAQDSILVVVLIYITVIY